jgi:hypothetical protein
LRLRALGNPGTHAIPVFIAPQPRVSGKVILRVGIDEEGNVIIDGITIHYYRSGGKKPPILLLHGATDDGLRWGRTSQKLADRYDVIMPDAQGHELSDRLGPDFSFKNHTKQAAGRMAIWRGHAGKGNLSAIGKLSELTYR